MTRALASWSMDILTQHCAEETQKFRQQLLSDRPIPHNTQYCYEIFYRAIAGHVDEAWERILTLYHNQVKTWIVRMPASTPYLDELDAMVNGAFIKFWRACHNKEFAAFPTLGAILAYLRDCARSTVHDWTAPAAGPAPAPDLDDEPSPDPFLWELVRSRCKTEKEVVVVREYFVFNLPPRDIFGRNPEVFTGAQDVSRTLENILERLKRDEDIRNYFERASR